MGANRMQTPFDPSHPAYDKWLREPLDDEERELMNPDTWDWSTAVESRTIGSPRRRAARALHAR